MTFGQRLVEFLNDLYPKLKVDKNKEVCLMIINDVEYFAAFMNLITIYAKQDPDFVEDLIVSIAIPLENFPNYLKRKYREK